MRQTLFVTLLCIAGLQVDDLDDVAGPPLEGMQRHDEGHGQALAADAHHETGLALVDQVAKLRFANDAPSDLQSRALRLRSQTEFGNEIEISGRPPVSNMYESIIWVAFVTAGLGDCPPELSWPPLELLLATAL